MIKINENTLRKIIRETILEALDERGSNMQSLYHFTTVHQLLSIIQTNCFYLSNWQNDTRGGDFMSFTRHKSGLEGFARANCGSTNVRIEVDPVKINSKHGGGLAPFEYYSPKQFEINSFAKVARNSDEGKGMSAKEKYRVFGDRFKEYDEKEYMNQAEEHYLKPHGDIRYINAIKNVLPTIKRIDVCMQRGVRDVSLYECDENSLEEIYELNNSIDRKIFIYDNERDFNLQTDNCMLLKDWLAFGAQNKYGKVVENTRK